MPGEWDAVHGGYDNTAALQDPNRVVPLDALRDLERHGTIGHLFDDLFVTVGNLGSLNAMRRIGAEIAGELVTRGVEAVIFPPPEAQGRVAVLRLLRNVNGLVCRPSWPPASILWPHVLGRIVLCAVDGSITPLGRQNSRLQKSMPGGVNLSNARYRHSVHRCNSLPFSMLKGSSQDDGSTLRFCHSQNSVW